MKINTTARFGFLLLFLFSINAAFSQSEKEIVEKGIKVVKTYKQDLDAGEKELFVDKVEYYDKNGKLVEVKDYGENGKKIKEWFKYKYDADGNCIEEIENDYRGRQQKRTVTKYENGLKVLREYYDYKDRIIKRRKYEYQYSE